jgi:polyisoprenyl-phosphate glycosyltransferase
MVSVWRKGEKKIVECVKLSRGKERWKNKIGSMLFYWLIEKLTGYQLKGATDFKLLDRQVVESWSRMGERNTFFRGMTSWMGFEVGQVHFHVEERVGGETKWSLYSLVRLALLAVVSFSSFPLRMVSITGVGFLFLSFCLSLHSLYQKITGEAVEGFTTVILIQLFVGSVTLLSLGVIGEYIAAIYNESKGRPRYIVEEWRRRDGKEA